MALDVDFYLDLYKKLWHGTFKAMHRIGDAQSEEHWCTNGQVRLPRRFCGRSGRGSYQGPLAQVDSHAESKSESTAGPRKHHLSHDRIRDELIVHRLSSAPGFVSHTQPSMTASDGGHRKTLDPGWPGQNELVLRRSDAETTSEDGHPDPATPPSLSS